jgi:hypothetical protein
MFLVNPYILVAGDITAPTITSASTANVDEGDTLIHSLTASETVTWSIIGGVDQAHFEISGSTLRWLSDGTKDFESPEDDDADNDYIVQIRATDLAFNTADQTITVTVNDISGGTQAFSMVMGGAFVTDSNMQTSIVPPGVVFVTTFQSADPLSFMASEIVGAGVGGLIRYVER